LRTNWAGNVTFMAPELRSAATVDEVQSIVAGAGQVRVLGSGHSFNTIADSDAVQVQLQGMNRVLSIDTVNRRVTVEGGIRYGELAVALHAEGWALANLASLPHISVAGAVATATHGSGSGLGNLATAVIGLEIVTAEGEVVSLSRDRDGERFKGAVVSLGALGVVTGLTLKIEPTYMVRQTVYTDLPFAVIEGDFDAVFDAATSVSVFTDWQGAAAHLVWLKDRVAAEAAPRTGFLGARPAMRKMHPLLGVDGADCTDQLGVPGPWHERLPHFRMGFTPSNGAEIQAEYFVPRGAAAEAVAIMRRHGERLAPVLMTSEIRTVAGDDLWLSPGNRGPYVGLHFTFRRDPAGVMAVLPAIEADLGPLGVVPHWGKVSTMDPGVIRARMPQMAAFRDLARSLDPKGKFQNAHLRRLFDA
jgi:alditol oxidase